MRKGGPGGRLLFYLKENTAESSSPLGRMMRALNLSPGSGVRPFAVSVSVAQGERLQNRRDRRQRDLHWSRLTQFDIP